MNYNKIQYLAEKRNMSVRKLIRIVGLSDGGYYKMVDRDTMTIKNLEKISEALQVSPAIFFEDHPVNSDNNIESININNGHSNNVKYEKNFFSKDEEKLRVENNRLLHENAQLRQEVSKLKDKIIDLLEKK